MLTEFGKKLRILRLEHNELLKNLADTLKVSPAFLSAVENGKKNIPKDWHEKISAHYILNSKDREELLMAINTSNMSLMLDLHNKNNVGRTAAMVFARNFDSLSDETAKKIIDLFNK